MKPRWLLIVAVLPGWLHASKTEDDLRARNSALEQRNATLSAAVAKQAGDGLKRVAAQSSSADAAAAGRQMALETAANIAAAALSDSATHAAEAKERELKAQADRDSEAARIVELRQVSDRNLMAEIIGFLALFIGGIGNAWNNIRHREKSDAHQEATKTAIDALEKTTNSKMDQMLKIKGEAEFAKGRIVGAETGDATAPR